MKEVYEKPIIEITEFETDDIIVTSGLSSSQDGTGDAIGWGAIN